jgi:hypothetical protein
MKNDIIKNKFNELTYHEYLNDDIYNIETEWDISDGWKYVDSLIENLTNEPNLAIPFEYIDRLVEEQDYLWYQDYLDSSSPSLVDKVKEYIEFNYPEFVQEDDELLIDERFSKSNMRDDIAKNFNSRKWVKPQNSINQRKLNSTNTELKDVLTW